MKQLLYRKSFRRFFSVAPILLVILLLFTGFKTPLLRSSSHTRNGYPTIYMVYMTGAHDAPSSYATPITEIECVGDGFLCAIYVEDLNLDGSISSSELGHFMYDYDSNSNGSLHDEAYIPGVLIKKSFN